MDSYEKQRAENFMTWFHLKCLQNCSRLLWVCELLKWTEIIDNLKKVCFIEHEGHRSTHQICL